MGLDFDTAEAAYHWSKFPDDPALCHRILLARSAHEAFKLAEANRAATRPDWADVRVSVMEDILREKTLQHEYVRRKLLETGDRELVEDSWRDSFWGWGPDRAGENQLGKAWMRIRERLRAEKFLTSTP